MTIYPKSITRPLEALGAASAYGALRLRLLGVGMHRLSLRIVMIGLVAGSAAFAQDDGSPRWLERASITRAKQPDWVTPLITASANLEEAVIYDISRKIPTNGIPLVTAGSNRGIQFVPFEALQLTFATTPYEFHNNTRVKNGFGDTQFGFKYRLASSNIEHKDFAISIATGVNVPTGSYQNGQHSGTFTPTVLGEKGWGPFNVQSTIGIQIPVSATHLTGQPYTFNTAFQYRLGKMLWPELEVNAMGNKGGPSDGKTQTFLTPGLFIGRLPVNRNMGLTFGVGMQIAATRYHTYNHNLLFSFPFRSRHGGRGKRHVPDRSTELMQSVCLNSQRALQLRIAVRHQSALSMHPVDRSTRVSNSKLQSCIREINTAKRAKKLEVDANREWHVACT